MDLRNGRGDGWIGYVCCAAGVGFEIGGVLKCFAVVVGYGGVCAGFIDCGVGMKRVGGGR